MKKQDAIKRVIVLTLIMLIIIAQTLIFWHYWNTHYNPGIIRMFVMRGQLLMVFLYLVLYVGISNIYGAFKIAMLRTPDLIFSQILSILFVNVIIYIQISLLMLRMAPVVPIIAMTCENILCSTVWSILAKYVYKNVYPPRDILLVFCDRDPDNLVKKVNSRKDKYHISDSIHIKEGLHEIEKTAMRHEAVLLCDIPGDIRNDIMKFCFSESIRVYVTPKLSDIMMKGSESNNLFDTPLFLMRNKGLKWEQRVVKRIFDVIVSLIMLIVLSPILLLIAALIKMWDGKEVFYKQDRLTIDGKVFQILKFRSMNVDAEVDGARLSMGDEDPRVTPIGKVIRKTHLDELPQLINILKGDMSLVGPRPERPEIAAEYEKSIPEFSFRLKVKAGLTGYAQVYGKYNTTPYDKLKLDLYYIEYYNFILDVKIFLMTLKILFKKDNTEGVKKGQKTALKEKPEKK